MYRLGFFFLVGQVLSTLKYGRLQTLLLTDAWFYRSSREMHLVLSSWKLIETLFPEWGWVKLPYCPLGGSKCSQSLSSSTVSSRDLTWSTFLSLFSVLFYYVFLFFFFPFLSPKCRSSCFSCCITIWFSTTLLLL